jgi:phytanoyl-CoA hydroxylase
MLPSELVAQFDRDGFCAVPGFLGPDEVGALLASVESICSRATVANRIDPHGNGAQSRAGRASVRRLYEPCAYYPEIRAVWESGDLLDNLEQLPGANLLFYYSKLNMKPPAIGSVVEWRQELAYYPMTNSDSLAVLFYLDEAGHGCMQMIPGVHRNGILDHTSNGYFRAAMKETSRQYLDDGFTAIKFGWASSGRIPSSTFAWWKPLVKRCETIAIYRWTRDSSSSELRSRRSR